MLLMRLDVLGCEGLEPLAAETDGLCLDECPLGSPLVLQRPLGTFFVACGSALTSGTVAPTCCNNLTISPTFSSAVRFRTGIKNMRTTTTLGVSRGKVHV